MSKMKQFIPDEDTLHDYDFYDGVDSDYYDGEADDYYEDNTYPESTQIFIDRSDYARELYNAGKISGEQAAEIQMGA